MSARNVYIAASFACMTGSIFGYSVGFIGGVIVLPAFLHHYSLDRLSENELASAKSAIVSMWLIGAMFGVFSAMPVCSRFGRKMCLAFSAALYVVGAVLQLVPTGDAIGLFELGRLLNGIGVGAGTLVSPIYISEISSPDDRGMLMSGYQVAIQVCALIGFWGAYAANASFPDTSDMQWQIPVSIQLVFGLILLGGSLYIPDSPLWLVEKDRIKSAEKSLAWLRMDDESSPSIASETEQIRTLIHTRRNADLVRPRKAFIREAFSKPIRKRLGVGCGLMALQTVAGLNALNFYAPTIFMSAGFTTVSSSLFLTGLFGAIKLIAAVYFMFYSVRIKGNRFWLILGSAACAISMFVLAYCVQSMTVPSGSEPTEGGLSVRGAIACLMVFVFAFFFGVSLGPISWNVCSEIFPTHLNTNCCAITTCVQWLFQIVAAVTTPHLITLVGWGTYLIFGIICTVSLVWCAFYVPETRGVPLGKAMDAVFDDTKDEEDYSAVEEVEDISEDTPLMAEHRARRRSSIAILV